MTIRRRLYSAVGFLVAAWSTVCAGTEALEAKILVRMIDEGVHGAVTKGSISWFVTQDSILYAYEDEDAIYKLPSADDIEREFFSVAEVDDGILVGSSRGVLAVQDSVYADMRLFDVEDQSIAVYFILAEEFGVWLGSDRGLFFKSGSKGRATPVPLPNGSSARIVYLERVGGRLWVGTNEDVYWLRDGDFVPVAPIKNVVEVVDQGGRYYLRTFDQKLFRFPDYLDPRHPLVGEIGEPVIDIEPMDNGEVWLSVNGRLMTAEASEGVLGRGVSKDGIRVVAEGGGFQWLIEEGAVYLRESGSSGGTFDLLAESAGQLELRSVHSEGSAIWLWGLSGLYRFYKDIDLRLVMNLPKVGGKEIWKDEGVQLRRVGYFRTETDDEVYLPSIDAERTFRVSFHSDREELDTLEFSFSGETVVGQIEEAGPVIVRHGKLNLTVETRDNHGNIAVERYGDVEIAKRPWSQWKILVVNITAGVVGAVILARSLAGIIGGLWACLLFRIIRTPWLLPNTRMRWFFSLVRFGERLTVVGLVAMPSRERLYSTLRTIYCKSYCRGSATPAADDILARLGSVSDIAESLHIMPSRARPGVTIDALQNSVARHSDPKFADKIPLPVRLGRVASDVSWDQIKTEVMKSLRARLVYSDEKFCQELLAWGSFVFLFSVGISNRRNVIPQLRAFFDFHHQGRNYMIVIA